MKRRRHSPEQVVRKLREADKLLAEGKPVAEVARLLEVAENTYHRWRNQFGGMRADDVKRLKELERENARLKAIVADQALAADDQALRAALRKIAEDRPRWGYRRAHDQLLVEGWEINRKRVHRLWREVEFPRFRGHLTACAVQARKDGVCRAENPTRIP